MNRLTLVSLVAAPAAAGAVAALVVGARMPDHLLYIESRLWSVPLTAGLLISAGLAVAAGWRRQLVRTRAQAAGAAHRVAAENHHRFLLRLDHELKNPITAMQAALANAPDSVAPQLLDGIAAQIRRLANLVADLRKLAELETRPIERAPVDLADLLAEVQELTNHDGRRLTVTLPQAPWPLANVLGDRDLLFLAVHNLLGNAVKFTEPGDQIELRARDEADRMVVVEVADTGTGIPADEIGQVWEELARGRAARGTPGMGMGLALVRGVVTRHGGTVSVRSREGHGTVVELRLPAAEPA